MNRSVIVLQWCVALVCITGGAEFALSQQSALEAQSMGIHDVIRLSVGWLEMVAAILFVIPRTLRIGGYGLLACFFVAVLLHLLTGHYHVAPLLLYASAVIVTMAYRQHTTRVAA